MSFPPQVPATLHLLLSASATSGPDGGLPGRAHHQLARWLGRGDERPRPAGLPRDHAAMLAGWTAPVPWAALWARRQGEAVPDAEVGHWLWLEPMQMAAGMNSVQMAQLPDPMDASELGVLAGLLQPLLQESGIRVRAGPGRLLARLPAALAVSCQPPETALHGELRGHLPAGPDAGRLRRLMTECQMVLHQAAEAGHWPGAANALWPWGTGTPGRPGNARVYADDPVAAALAPAASPAAAAPGPALQALQAQLEAGPAGAAGPALLVLLTSTQAPGLVELLDTAEAALGRRWLAAIEFSCWSSQAPAGALRATRYLRHARWRLWRAPSPPFPPADHA